jgi:hypothetical protein
VAAAFLLAGSGEEKTAIREYIEKTFGYNPLKKWEKKPSGENGFHGRFRISSSWDRGEGIVQGDVNEGILALDVNNGMR